MKFYLVRYIFLFLLTPFLLRAGTNEGSILLHNDTTIILTAIIQASDGRFLGQFSIQPGEQTHFTTNLSPTSYVKPGTPNISLTPYTVIWQCPSESVYSMCTTVQPGSYVRASWCDGIHYCTPKKKDEKEAPAPASKLKKQ